MAFSRRVLTTSTGWLKENGTASRVESMPAPDDPEGGLGAFTGDLDGGFAEVELGMARRMGERDEGLFGMGLGVFHRGLDLGVAAGVAVFVTQAIEDASGRVVLFGRSLIVIGQDLLDGGQMRAEHGLSPDLCHLIAGWFGVGQDLGQGLVPDPIVTVDGALRRAFDQDLASDLGPFVHVGVHPSPVLLVRSGPKP